MFSRDFTDIKPGESLTQNETYFPTLAVDVRAEIL